jgi:hypothetical protein
MYCDESAPVYAEIDEERRDVHAAKHKMLKLCR